MNYDIDLFQDLKLTKRKPLNLIHNLIGREYGTNSSTLGITSAFSGYSNRNERTRRNQLKRIYLAVTPNYTIIGVKTPNCYFRRFSPDGRYLIGFNQYLNGVQIFQFNGSSSGIQHLASLNAEQTCNDKTDFNDYESEQLRHRAFDIYFKETRNIRLADNNELMNRECALFFKSSYLIVASSEIISDDNLPPYEQISTNNESIHFGLIENYTIYLVDVVNGRLSDKIHFKADKLNLIHGQSLCLFRNVFTVLSQQNQTIHVFNIVPEKMANYDGSEPRKIVYKFQLVNRIGRFCVPDDNEFIQNPQVNLPESTQRQNKQQKTDVKNQNRTNAASSSPSTSASSTSSSTYRYRSRTTSFSNNAHPAQIKAFSENCFTSMKHRILSFFYREALETNSVSQFYVFINSIINLKMHRMQLLDERHVLIKYISGEHMTNQKFNSPMSSLNPILGVNNNTATNSTNTVINQGYLTYGQISQSSLIQQQQQSMINENTTPSYFILYDMKNCKILNILRNTSAQLLNVYEHFQDYFSLSVLDSFDDNTSLNGSVFNSSFSFHTLPSNNIYARQILQRNFSKYNSHVELAKYILSLLPMSSQSYTSTPYLDHSLFSFDEKLISNLERPKPIGDQIIKFNNRETSRLSFRLYPGTQAAAANANANAANYHHSSAKRLVAFIWHPREPFCISVQRANQEYNMNFHVYTKNFF